MQSLDKNSVSQLGFRNTIRGLWQKLPLFAAAAIAMLVLTTLDRAKTNYEILRGSGSFEIDQEFLDTLYPEATAQQSAAMNAVTIDYSLLRSWLNEPYRFKYQKFANNRALLDALAAKAMVEKETRRGSLEKKRGELEEEKQNLGKELSKLKARSKLRTTIENQIKDKTIENECFDFEIDQLEPDFKRTTNYVYTTFGDKLPNVLFGMQGRAPGWRDDLLKPILNEQSSLNVVYQVFRLTALIIVVLSFVFILVMLIQQSPFSGDTDTVSTQLRTLISLKSAGVAGEIAKTAIISVTALGVGTAVFMGATSPDTPPGPPYPYRPGSETIRERVRDVLFPNSGGDVVWNPVAEEYFLQTLLSEQYRNSYFYDLRRYTNGSQTPTIKFDPTILPAPVGVRVVRGGDNQALLVELNKLITKVNSASDLTSIKLQIATLQADLARLNQPNCQCQEKLDEISKRIETLNKIIGGNAIPLTPTPSPSPSPSASPSPSTDSSSAKNPTPTPTPPPTLSILDSLTKTTSALDVIKDELKAMRADNLNKLGASSRNFGTRTGELFGSEHYLVTEQVYLALEALLQGDVKYAALVKTLQNMKNQPPLKKGKFLSALRNGKTEDQLKDFKPWERVILNYARLRR